MARGVEGMTTPAAGLFKAYDIRGVVETDLTPEAVRQIGRAIGAEARARGQRTLAIGRDGRSSGSGAGSGAERGLRQPASTSPTSGCAPRRCSVAVHHLQLGGGVMVTGSHNPPQYNGLKMVLAGETPGRRGDARPAPAHRSQRLRARPSGGGRPAARRPSAPPISTHLRRRAPGAAAAGGDRLRQRLAGAGGAGAVPRLGLRGDANCSARSTATFPNHHPDPAPIPHNLQDLMPLPAGDRLGRRSAWPSMATATASAWSPAAAR
jgi:phosphomannomutase/phosphoglucomutase